MLGRFYSLLPEMNEFRNLKKCPLIELEDENWLCDLGFMVDITKHLNDLKVQLQGPDTTAFAVFQDQIFHVNAESLGKSVHR